MINIVCSSDKYIYNAYHITKAFFPDEKIASEKDPSQKEAIRLSIEGQTVNIYEGKSKDETDKALYKALKELTGRELPWGILTGIRPAKPAVLKLREGMSRAEFIKWYGEEKLVSTGKAAEAYDIAETELKVLHSIRPEGSWTDSFSLYINIPFCQSICSYCSFSSGLINDYGDRVDMYLQALVRELEAAADMAGQAEISTIYIGGGTPTALNERQLEYLMKNIAGSFQTNRLKEFCVEAGRPDSINREKLEIIKAYGAGRISVNPQTMQQKTLDAVGRSHSVSDIYRAFNEAREVGFDNINMDLIAGLPGETAADMEDTLKKIMALGPESLTVHVLSIKRRAAMESQTTAAFEIEKMIELSSEYARKAGMKPYYLYRQKSIAGNFENVGYSKPKKEGLYNILTMEEVQTIYGIGAGAETKFVLDKTVPNPNRGGKAGNILRCSNVSDVDEYIRRVDEMVERKEEMKSYGA